MRPARWRGVAALDLHAPSLADQTDSLSAELHRELSLALHGEPVHYQERLAQLVER